VLTLVFIVLGLALALAGLLFAVVGTQAALEPYDAGHVIATVLVAAVGLAAVVGGIAMVFRYGRKPPSLGHGSGGYFGDGGSFFGGGRGR